MSEVEWTNDAVIRLVQEYRERPVLWDTSHSLYRAQNAKYAAYMQLANLFDCDIVDLRKKLNSIFASHRREKGKVRRGHRSLWFLYPYLSFLPNHIDMTDEDDVLQLPNPKKRKAKEDSEEEPSEENDGQNEDNGFDNSFDNNIHEEVMIKNEVEDSVIRPKSYRPLQPHYKRRLTKSVKKLPAREVTTSQQLDNRLLEALKLLRRSELSKKRDECDSFGEYIAVSLRKHDERTQSMIKQAINNILFEQEMKKYSNTQYVVISGVDTNPLTLGNDSPEK